jgi:hypothetical protein
MSRLDRFKATAFLAILACYILFNYPFMQFRIPPAGFGLPVGEILLVLVLLTTDLPRVLLRMNATVMLLPFLIWWGWGFARFVYDATDRGFWAFRDSTQLVESLYLLVGFALAAQPGMVARLARWLGPIIFGASVISLLSIFATDLSAISPKLPGASGQDIAILAPFATPGTMALWGACYCIIKPHESPAARMRFTLLAAFLIAFALLMVQARTSYLQLLAVAGLMLMCRPRALRPLAFAIPLLFGFLVLISAFDLQLPGRLTADVSPAFIWDHILSIFGIGEGSLAAAAAGVDLRLGWWTSIYHQLTADEITLLTGLGFGIPLTDFRDTLGVVTREPHNSVISVTARLGLVGILAWLWMQVELFRAGLRTFKNCCRTGRSPVGTFVLVCLVFAVLTLASCLGEDAMEKPYNAIPYYALWGFILRIAYQLRTEKSKSRISAAVSLSATSIS